MSPAVTVLLLVCFAVVALLLLFDLFRSQHRRPVIIQLGVLVLLFIVLKLTTGFPSTRQAFGGTTPIVAIGIMFLSTMLGIGARYFYQSKRFYWRSFIKPMFITPIVLLPLISSVQTSGELESIQVLSLALLAFQNGFFWKVVLEHAEPKL